MSFTIEQGKESGLVQINVIPKPLILCQVAAIDGDTVYLTTTPDLGGSTQTYGGNSYQARLLSNVMEQIQAQSPQGYDIPGSITLEIADGDFAIWLNHAKPHGWRGGTLTVLFVLWDIPSNAYSTNAYTWTFILDKPNIDSSGVLTVSAQARQSLTRLNVPNVLRQNRCTHDFPSTAAQRLAGLTDPTSPYYACGYSPDQTGGVGNQTTPNLTNPDGSPLTDASGNYVMCDYTRSCGASKATRTQGCMARLGNYSATTFYGGSTPCASDGDIIDDTSNRRTGRFDGDTWLAPVGYSGRQYINPSAGVIYGFNAPNPPTGTTAYNQVYGTQWVNATVLEPASAPNTYTAECIVCVAQVQPATILKVLVNGVEVTQNNGDRQFTYSILSAGGRSSTVSLAPIWNGQGDPHGGLCWIVITVPPELQSSGSIASVQVLVEGPPCLHVFPIASAAASGGNTILTLATGVVNNVGAPYYDGVLTGMSINISGNSGVPKGGYTVLASTAGPPGTITIPGSWSGTGGAVYFYPEAGDGLMSELTPNGLAVAANPVWALMDLLTWGPFTIGDFEPQSWYNAAQVCAAQINYTDINGNTATHARYRCSFALVTSNRQSLAKAVLGLRNAAGIILARDPVTGLLQCFIEQTLADQQPAAIPGSNYSTPVSSVTAANAAANGYLAYLFDGAGSIEKGTFKITGRSLNDTPNTVSIPFQDSANSYVQDSCTTIDPEGYITAGNQEIEAPVQFMGLENFDQATRRANVELAKALYGNARFDAGGSEIISLRTTAKAAHLASRVGYICGITYQQLGL
jgi:hypothetical protein